LDRWAVHAQRQQVLDIGDEMMRLTLCIVGEALVSRDLTNEADELGQTVTVAMQYVNYRIRHLLAPPLFVPTPRNLQFKRAKRKAHEFIKQVIRERRDEGTERNDFLGMLMAARDEQSGAVMSDQQVRDEALTFLAAGHETTALALTWTWYLLSQHPDVERRLRAEVDQVLNRRLPTFDDISRLQLTRRVIEESMRLFPPVWMLSRTALQDDVVGGFHIPAGSLILVSQYVTHRHPDFWPDPENFDPDRFLPERVAKRPRYAYFPFSGGPRICIGNHFAMMEAILAVAMTIQRFRIQILPDHPVVADPIFTLRPKYGVRATVHCV